MLTQFHQLHVYHTNIYMFKIIYVDTNSVTSAQMISPQNCWQYIFHTVLILSRTTIHGSDSALSFYQNKKKRTDEILVFSTENKNIGFFAWSYHKLKIQTPFSCALYVAPNQTVLMCWHRNLEILLMTIYIDITILTKLKLNLSYENCNSVMLVADIQKLNTTHNTT